MATTRAQLDLMLGDPHHCGARPRRRGLFVLNLVEPLQDSSDSPGVGAGCRVRVGQPEDRIVNVAIPRAGSSA